MRRTAAVLLALALAAAVAVPAAAETVETVLVEYLPVKEGGYILAEIAEPAASLADMRAVQAADVAEEDRDAACYAVFRGLLPLLENGTFSGDRPVSRGEAVQALYRLTGILVRVDECRYPDVPEEYRDAVAWAVSCGISSGLTADRFGPGSPVTRSQLAVMLHRFAQWRGEDMTCRTAVSSGSEPIPAYAQEAWNWAADRGLYQGMTSHGLYPGLPVSRLQLAAILARLQRDRDPLAAALSLPSGAPASRSLEQHEAISQAVSAAAGRYGAVGVQVAVIEGGAVTDTYCYGWAVKGSEAMTAQHKMRIASLSKVAVGISAALLREEGVVDYDANIGEYWGVTALKPVTIRSILTHTSTLRNSESIAWDYEGVKAQLVSKSGYGSGTPGSLGYWSYNNHAFGILGQTLELASGRYLDDILEERLLGFLGADSAFAPGDLKQPELITPLYRGSSLGRGANIQRSIRRWSSPGATGRYFAGGFTTSARDMAKLTALLAGDGRFEGIRLMDADSVELIESHGSGALAGGVYQALPLRYRRSLYGREGLYYHTGSAYGVYNLLSYDPFTGDGVVVLTMGASGRTDAYGIYAVCGEISRAVYDAIR